MITILIVTFFFNLFDTIITLIVTQRGYIELNPVTRILLYNPTLFAVVKISLVSLALWWLYLHRNERLARVAIWCAFGIYCAVMVHYCITYLIIS
jgi:hypothetical protein